MSYTFTASGADKALALADVDEKLAAVIAKHPAHEADRDMIRATVERSLDQLGDDDTTDLVVMVAGHIATTDGKVMSHGLSVNAAVRPKPVDE